MTAPGWYHADGDPVGTQRYWDGTQWLGERVYEPAAPPVAPYPPTPGGYTYGPPASQSTFPGSLKTLAILLSVIKALPLALGFFVVLFIGAVANDLEDSTSDYGEVFDEVLSAALIIGVLILIAGAALLLFQFIGALRERPTMVFVPALIMAVLDTLSTVSAWVGAFGRGGSPGWAIIMTAVTAAQIAIVVQASAARSSR